MNKELEAKIQQMAEKEFPLLFASQNVYKQGFNAADAVGFAKFYMEFNSELEEGNLSVEEAYLQYLNRGK